MSDDWRYKENWSDRDIADWLGMELSTVRRHVLTQPGFPKGFRPTGHERGDKRWFADQVRNFYREKAA